MTTAAPSSHPATTSLVKCTPSPIRLSPVTTVTTTAAAHSRRRPRPYGSRIARKTAQVSAALVA